MATNGQAEKKQIDRPIASGGLIILSVPSVVHAVLQGNTVRLKMLLRRCGSGVPVVLVALLAVQLCWRTVIVAADEEQAAREWLEKFYLLAERRQYASAVASWNFQVNITEENNQRVVSRIRTVVRKLVVTAPDTDALNCHPRWGSGSITPGKFVRKTLHTCTVLQCVTGSVLLLLVLVVCVSYEP